MKKCKAFIVFILICIFSICDAQQTDAKFYLEKLIYHASRCNGSCPEINIEIEKDKKIYVTRQIFKSKSEIDSEQSGTFNGRLKKTD